ncbi:hypothetical protein HS125_05885 [bacterium]|nr:hypothetical protein [bacterium]
MKTYHLSFQPDPVVPRFLQLAVGRVDIPAADVFEKGVHPIWNFEDPSTLQEAFVERLNSPDVKLPHLEQLGYCENADAITQARYYQGKSPFEQLVEHLNHGVRFVSHLTYVELLDLAKQRLRATWDRKVAYTLLGATHPDFDAKRSFVKARDKRVKISGYADFDNYDLSEILSLDDFADHEQVLIREGLPVVNFRSTDFLLRVTDEQGRLRLADRIPNFTLVHPPQTTYLRDSILYQGECRQGVIHLHPDIGKALSTRSKAREIAERWRTGGGQYCFRTTPARVDEMLTTEQFRIAFPSLDYRKKREPGKAQAAVPGCRVDRYSVGNYLRENAAVNTFKDVLRGFGVSLTGRKEELVEKLAHLAARQYEEKAPELDDYFGENRFVRIKGGNHETGRPFPILENHLLRHMLLAMYVQKHLRGNTVLEAGYSNDTFDTLDLARALIQRNITLNGAFLPVV